MKRLVLAALAAFAVSAAFALPFTEVKSIAYAGPSTEPRLLDLSYPTSVTGFATVVNIHGGGLVAGQRSYAPWPGVRSGLDPVAHVAVGYRLLTNATPNECVGDAAAAVAWVLAHIADYGGDPKKVFLTGVSGGGYLTAMIGLDPSRLAPFGFKPTDLAGIAPLTGQMTKHFNIRAVGFADREGQFTPKVDAWAPLAFATKAAVPPCCFLTGGRDVEWKARVEENALLAASLRAFGHRNVAFIETEGDHGGGVTPSSFFLRDFVMREVEAGGVGRFAPNERVAFFGDSITHDGRFVCDLQVFAALRHPGWNVACLNAGISGDTAAGALNRWSWDVLPQKPDRIFAMFGMNDVDRDSWRADPPDAAASTRRRNALARYARNVAQLSAMIAPSRVKRVLVTPSPYDQYSDLAKACNRVCNEPGLAACAEAVRAVARRENLGLVEFHKPMTALLRRHPARHLCGGDRVHPGNEGHLLMAALILEAMGENPLVARVAIDAARGCVEKLADGKTRFAVVTACSAATNGVRFTYAPKALPLPDTPASRALDEIYPFTARFNQEVIVVRGLAAGRYDLAFDGVKVGSFTAAEFEKGVNVALLPTPNQLRARETARLAAELKKRTEDLRHCICLLWRPKRAGIDLKDIPAVIHNLEPWIVEMERQKQPWIPSSRRAFEQCKAAGWDLSAFEAEVENLRERINAVRPAVSRVTILPAVDGAGGI